MQFGIPMSGKEPLEKKVNSVTYLLKQPIGKVERELKAIQGDVFDIRPYIEPASDEFDKKNKGKKLKPGERVEAIAEIASALAEKDFWNRYSPEENAKKQDDTFDLICDGWKGSPFKFDDIEEGNNPSDHIPSHVKEKLVTWYLEQMTLTGEERKNSTRRRVSNSESQAA